MRLKAGTYNLCGGGLDPGPDGISDARLRQQLDLLAGLDLDLLGLQEATWGHPDDPATRRRLHAAAHHLGMRWRVLVPSAFHHCHLAVFARETSTLRVTAERHLHGPPWVHALADVELAITGRTRPLRFLVAHFAPSSPAVRQAEAEMLAVYRDLDVIVAADCNTRALNETPTPPPDADPEHARRKLHPGPARALHDAGYHDTGTVHGDTTPTVGHTGADRLAYRCDRIHTTLPPTAIRAHHVITGHDLSDHHPVAAEFHL